MFIESILKLSLTLLAFLMSTFSYPQNGKHLFILSGQSNMKRMLPQESFTPMLVAEFGPDNVIVVKDAKGGAAIRLWFDRDSLSGQINSKTNQNLYAPLLRKVKNKIELEKINTITFIWMQGERDAREGLGEVYENALIGLYKKLSDDLNITDMNMVIGRLSDFDLSNEKCPHWNMIRDIQVRVGESNPRFSWVNTDDLNDGLSREGKILKNDLHMSKQGYKKMGGRFAKKAIQLIKRGKVLEFLLLHPGSVELCL